MSKRATSKAKRILIIVPMPYGPPWREGVSNLTRRLVDFLSQNGFEAIVLSPQTTPRGPKVSVGDIGETVIRIETSGSRHWFKRLSFWSRTLLELIFLKDQVDAIFLFASVSTALGFRSQLIKLASGIPLVLYVTGLGNPPPITHRLVNADRLLVISPFLRKWFPNAEVLLPFLPVHLACTEDNIRSQRNEAFHFLYLGALERERGVEYMLKAFAIATRSSDRSLVLTLAWDGRGDYTLDYIEGLLSELNIRPNVRVCGVVDTAEAYKMCDSVVIPRISETRMAFPVRILEALYMQKPLIVTDACDMGDLIEGCGLAVRRADSEAMATAMIRIAEDFIFYQRCVSNCKIRSEQYDSVRSLTQLHAIIEDVIS